MVLPAATIAGIAIGSVVVGGIFVFIVWLIYYTVRNGGNLPRGCREDHAA